ncbi:transposase (plasmid) [Mesorhizobium sp. AR10]|uniref:transposase n=1 Tax=Mesorhizobium sp. AR10 TaxID=2865839 RepID=UPI00215F844C|nr:transposase [Mesorhizobium sp. AR10]UVK35906.1 transposase [Mesorhizobium sp. AR10]
MRSRTSSSFPPARQYRRNFAVPRTGSVSGGNRKSRASKRDCQSCELKRRCYPKTPVRDVLRCVHEEARETAVKADTPEFGRSRNERKKVEMLFARLKTALRFERRRLRGLSGACDEFLMGAITPATTGAADHANGAGTT